MSEWDFFEEEILQDESMTHLKGSKTPHEKKPKKSRASKTPQVKKTPSLTTLEMHLKTLEEAIYAHFTLDDFEILIERWELSRGKRAKKAKSGFEHRFLIRIKKIQTKIKKFRELEHKIEEKNNV